MRSFLVAVLALAIAGCGASIRPGQKGLKYKPLRQGLQQEVRGDGFYFQLPWNDVIVYQTTWQTRTEDLAILTSEDLHVTTKVAVTFRPMEPRLYELATQIGPKYYEQVVLPPFLTLARSEFARHAHNELAEDSPAIEAAVLAKLREAVAEKPIEIDRVVVVHIEFDPAVSKSISSKMTAEQMIAQKDSEVTIAKKEADIARARAAGEADATRIRAEGEAKAAILKGAAQAEAQAAITKTLTPAYLQYKAFDGPATRYYFVPTKNGMPVFFTPGEKEDVSWSSNARP